MPTRPVSPAGIALAVAAAGLFACAPAARAPERAEAVVDCMGVNACRGQSDGKLPSHGCSFANACRGEGFLRMSRAECEQRGGKTL